MSRLTLGKGEAASDVSRGTAAKTGRALLINSLALNFPPKTGAEHLLESILEGRGFSPPWVHRLDVALHQAPEAPPQARVLRPRAKFLQQNNNWMEGLWSFSKEEK